MGPMTLVEMLERHAVKTPGKPAIIFHNNRMTYRELNDTVNKLANFFLEKGLRKGDRVCLMLPRIPELIIGFLAIAKAHGIAVPVNFELSPESVRDILKKISPRYFIVHSSFLEVAKKSVPDSFYTEIIATDGEGAGYISLTDILNKGNTNNPGLDIKSNDVVYFNYTSGSTGDSKGAITTYDNIYWNTFASVEALGLTKDDVHPYDAISWERRSAKIVSATGNVIFQQDDVEVPAFWSQSATDIVAEKYFASLLWVYFFCHMIFATKFSSLKISSNTCFKLQCSLSSMDTNIEPSSDNKSLSNLRRGYIMQSHLSCRQRSSESRPTTFPSHFLILGELTLSL